MGIKHLGSTRRWLTFSIVAALVAMAICLWRDAHIIQADILERAENALARRGLDPSSLVYADGRDITLRGQIRAKIDRREILLMVRSLLGVRSVADELSVLAHQPARLTLDLDANTARLRGELHDENSMDEIIKAVARIHGVKWIDNRMRVTESTHKPDWLDGLVAFLPWYTVEKPARLTISDKTMLLEGLVDTAEQRETIGSKADAAFLGLMSVGNAIKVLPPDGRAYLAINLSDRREGIITLFGALDDQTSIQRVITQVKRHFEASQVRNHLRIERVRKPKWLDELDALLSKLSIAESAAFSIGASGVAIFGTANETGQRTLVETLAHSMADDLPLVKRIQIRSVRSSQSAYELTKRSHGDEVLSNALTNGISMDKPVDLIDVDETLHQRQAETQMTKLGSVEFMSNSARLDTRSTTALDQMLGVLARHPGTHVEIAAHTDSLGSRNYNLALSRRRAETVAEYLVVNGFEPHRLIATWYGATRPIADNETTSGRASNRRVEIRILGKLGE